MLIQLRSDVAVEELDGEVLFCDTARAVVHRVPRVDAPWVADLVAGATVEVGDGALVGQLIDAGLVEPVVTSTDESAGTDRRRIITRTVGVAAAVGVASIALPAVAAAESFEPDPPA